MQKASILKSILIFAGTVIILAGMHLSASFLAPVLLAFFFAILLSPVYRWLRKHMPNGLALLLVMGIFLGVALFIVSLIGTSVTVTIDSLDAYNQQLEQRQADLVASHPEWADSSIFKAVMTALDPAVLVNAIGYMVGIIFEVFKSGFLILLITMFILAESTRFRDRLNLGYGKEHPVPKRVSKLTRMLIDYFGLRAIVNLVVAGATGIMLWVFGIEHAGLWTVLIFFLSFVPYIGAVIAMIPPLVLAFAQGGLELAIIVGLLAVLINGLSENIVSPLIMGKGLSISSTVVFLSFLFWMFILGGSGALIAMPLTVGVILFLEGFEEAKPLVTMVVTFPETVESGEKSGTGDNP